MRGCLKKCIGTLKSGKWKPYPTLLKLVHHGHTEDVDIVGTMGLEIAWDNPSNVCMSACSN